MVELKGSLSSIGLPAIVQLIGELHHSGNLELTRGPSAGVLGFDDGHLVAASFDDKRSLNALSACVLDVRHEAAEAGDFSEGLDSAKIRELIGPLAAALTGRTGEHISISGETGTISVFACGEARLAVVHRARVFLPGVREKLIATADALSRA